MSLNSQAVRGLRLIGLFAFMQVLPSAVILLLLVSFTYFGVGQNSPVYAQMGAWACTAMVGAVLMHYHFRRIVRADDIVHPVPLAEIVRISSPMMVTAAMAFLLGQTGVIFLGIFRTETEVGLYAIAVKLATLTSFLLAAINSMAAPKFAELFYKGELGELLSVARKSTKLAFWATLPILLMLVLLGETILKTLYGTEFAAAYPAMMIMVVGQVINGMSGSTGNLMNMTGNEREFRNMIVAAALVNVALSFILIPRFGMLGAAASAAVCLVIWNVGALVYIKHHFGRSIAYVPFL
jgi:O-antigen/teichoic acid export membrane protein